MTTHQFSDHEKIQLSIKLNPLWWLGNDTEQTVDQAEWYHQNWPEWRRSLGWALRNPLQNFRAFIINSAGPILAESLHRGSLTRV